MEERLCSACGAAVGEGEKFCSNCGALVQVEATVAPAPAAVGPAPEPASTPVATMAPAPAPQPAASQGKPLFNPNPKVPKEAKPPKAPKPKKEVVPVEKNNNPIGMWGYFLTLLVMCIPIAGIVVAVLLAIGKGKNIHRENLAKAVVILDAIGLVIFVAMLIVFMPIVKAILF